MTRIHCTRIGDTFLQGEGELPGEPIPSIRIKTPYWSHSFIDTRHDKARDAEEDASK